MKLQGDDLNNPKWLLIRGLLNSLHNAVIENEYSSYNGADAEAALQQVEDVEEQIYLAIKDLQK